MILGSLRTSPCGKSTLTVRDFSGRDPRIVDVADFQSEQEAASYMEQKGYKFDGNSITYLDGRRTQGVKPIH